jgi:DNA-entry nuclease
LKVKKIFVGLLAALVFCLCGCSYVAGNNETSESEYTTEADTLTDTTDSILKSETATNSDREDSDGDYNYTQTNTESSDNNIEISISIDDIPAYSGSAYVVINGDQPDFSDGDKQITDAFEFYSELDSLGRCGQAYANICPELQPTEERGEIGQIKPSGWHTVKYNDLVDGNYLYNRCHLIGYQLAGENANEKNLITGTRYLNVEGMLPFEDEVDDYVDTTGNHVLYRVTPIFEGNNLVASGVQMEAWSVEDEGSGVCFNVYCYNVQPGIEINYATGDSWESENVSETNTSEATDTTEEDNSSVLQTDNSENDVADNDTETRDYILNKNTKKIHLPSCSSVDDMAEKNKVSYNGTIEELEEQGYSPCKRCLN